MYYFIKNIKNIWFSYKMEIEMNELLVKRENFISENAAESSSEEIIKNILKKNLREESKNCYNEACRIFKIIISNIVQHPDEEKYRMIKQNNPKFQNSFGKYKSGISLLEKIGFEYIQDTEPIYLYSHSDICLLE